MLKTRFFSNFRREAANFFSIYFSNFKNSTGKSFENNREISENLQNPLKTTAKFVKHEILFSIFFSIFFKNTCFLAIFQNLKNNTAQTPIPVRLSIFPEAPTCGPSAVFERSITRQGSQCNSGIRATVVLEKVSF